MNTCSTCHYWAGPNKKGEKVACYRYPPRTEIQNRVIGTVIISVWPLTSGLDWCGEHKIKESGQND